MSTKELAESLTVTGKELQSVLRHDRVIGEEVMKCAVVAWRPGSSEHAPLRPAMAVQPGDTTDSVEVPGNGYTTHPKPNKAQQKPCRIVQVPVVDHGCPCFGGLSLSIRPA